MKILILGGTGTLSTEVVKISYQKGYNVTIFNRGNNNIKVPKGIKIIKGDFYNTDSLQQCVEEASFDVIVDFLSRKPSDINRVYPVLGFICSQYIFVSSACVYKRADADLPLNENSSKPNVDWNYSVEKYSCEQLLIQWSKRLNKPYTIVRPYITYDIERIPLPVAPSYCFHRTIIERILNDKPMFVWNGGDNFTTVTHVTDFALFFVELYLNPKALNEDFHITTNKTYTHKEILLTLYKMLNKEPNIVNVSLERTLKVLRNYRDMIKGDRNLPAIFDNSKIRNAVPNLSFDLSLEEGLKRNIDYYNNLNTYDYDYMFEGQIDRLLSFDKRCRYVRYKGQNTSFTFRYFLYRYLPFSVAIRIDSWIKIRK